MKSFLVDQDGYYGEFGESVCTAFTPLSFFITYIAQSFG